MAFIEQDLDDLDRFLNDAEAVVPYIDVQRGVAPPGSVAMRHDVDHSLEKALRFAAWEADRGYRSTYFVLHSAPYYNEKEDVAKMLNELVMYGHEVGFHNDALCATDGDVVAAAELINVERKWMQDVIHTHYSILGIADHGGSPHSNGNLWEHYTPESLGFEYEAYKLQRAANTFLSDNQGRWRSPLKMANTFMLVHPTWWPV